VNHADHVALIRPGIPVLGGVWADFGAGDGAFTLALADVLGPDGVIHAVDKDGRALRRCQRRLSDRFPAVTLTVHAADFTRPLDDLPPLDGIVMANALHFQRDKRPVLEHLRTTLKPGGHLIVVEYDTTHGNRWVPYPLTYAQYEPLAAAAGFATTRRLGTRPSSFLGGFFSALSVNPV